MEEGAVKASIFKALCTEMDLKPGRMGINIRNLEVLCANLKSGKARSLSRTKNFWSDIPTEYNPEGISYKMVSVVDQMGDHGYLEQQTGFKDELTGKGFNTRLMATPLLMRHIEDVKVIKHPDAPPLILKDVDHNLISYRDTGYTRAMKAQLRRYNRLLADTIIELDGTELEPTQKFVYRVFNHGKWSRGGRFYGAAWHTCKKELRETIRINGDTTVEPDYSALHPCMAYAMSGLRMPEGDLYDLPDIPDRKYGKVAMLIMFNAKDRRSATGAYNDEFRGDTKKPKASEVFDKILEKHPPKIQKLFFSGIGLKLQNKDSKLAEVIIDTLTREGIPCLSVHDSFRVQKKYADKLVEIMASVFRGQWGDKVRVPKIHY